MESLKSSTDRAYCKFRNVLQELLAKPLFYIPIDSAKLEIRLISLAPGRFKDPIVVYLNKAALLDQPTYEALSYVWGDTISDERICVNGALVTVTSNLLSALRHLRSEQISRRLWIDAISINQQDITERNAQVHFMASIYSFAANVVIWLGPEADKSNWAIRRMSTYYGARKEQELSELLPIFTKLCQRPWFRRIWVVQEVTLASKDPLVCCGTEEIRWDKLCSWLRLLQRDASIWIGSEQKSMKNKFADALENIFTLHRCKSVKFSPFATRIHQTSSFQATDPRDKIYGILAMSTSPSRIITPDYTKTVAAVFCEAFAAVLIDNFSLGYPVTPLQPPRNSTAAPSIGLPSWVPDRTMCELCSHTEIGRYHLPGSLIPWQRDTRLAPEFSGLEPNEVISFSDDLRSLHTYGRHLGVVVGTISTQALFYGLAAKGGYALQFDFQSSPHESIITFARQHNVDLLQIQKVLICTAKNREQILNSSIARSIFADILHGKFGNISSYSPKIIDNICNALQHSAMGKTLFVTDQGQVGLSYHLHAQDGIRSGDTVVGLFGIGFPFILRQVANTVGSYNMINVAYVEGYRWGRESIKTIPGSERRGNISGYGLEKYTIV